MHKVVETAEGVFRQNKKRNKILSLKHLNYLGLLPSICLQFCFGGAVAMLPVFASDILFAGPQGLGLLRACPAIGATLMAFVLMFVLR